jgi:hypothetical protein
MPRSDTPALTLSDGALDALLRVLDSIPADAVPIAPAAGTEKTNLITVVPAGTK